MRLSIGGQSVGGSNDNADKLTNWDTRIGNIEVISDTINFNLTSYFPLLIRVSERSLFF